MGRTFEAAPIPFKENIAILIDNKTYCAAEICAAVLLEYSKLRDQGEINGVNYLDEFYPNQLMVIGTSLGKTQSGGFEDFKTPLGVLQCIWIHSKDLA